MLPRPAFRIAAWPASPGQGSYPLLRLGLGCLGVLPASFHPLPFPVATETLSSRYPRGSRGGGGWADEGLLQGSLLSKRLQPPGQSQQASVIPKCLPRLWERPVWQEVVAGCKARAAALFWDTLTQAEKARKARSTPHTH